MTGEREIELILSAAAWLAATPKNLRPRPAVVELKERFGLNPVQACAAIREHQRCFDGGADANVS
ncbi:MULTISPECIES: hypothetical protein [unclassified Mesorhizobium]|uniref:hypothetical protein n=1 Tax=unclassified Mesorhizobium TaxID=325217 RepID=UPI000FCB1E69|nr:MULTISPECIES: hypothetical protein [unclassified Mesorhizobium]RVD54534.1 hypothetical protein EN783_30350 [Mesorhizobium sp. M2D.F.Ca.ET.140.01.1.1]TGP69387.1 hypothetical protein EN867_30930 [Mesorhizobium sp. M2D.F.Ca.ET.224.01.1.1]TGP86607.1 hypothetical protein EN865_30925 [bacterium M00.F.Ca.ET.222.01.1.1]